MFYDMFMFHDFNFRRLPLIFGGSLFLVVGLGAIIMTICIFNDVYLNDEHAIKELVRDVRAAY